MSRPSTTGGGGISTGNGAAMAGQARYTRDNTNDINYRNPAALSWDIRQQTEYGTLRTYIRFGAQVTPRRTANARHEPSPFWDRAFISLRASPWAGLSRSSTSSPTAAPTATTTCASPVTPAHRARLWAYTAQFGNGFSGTLSLEDPAGPQRAARST